jgi:hypothetical protein
MKKNENRVLSFGHQIVYDFIEFNKQMIISHILQSAYYISTYYHAT